MLNKKTNVIGNNAEELLHKSADWLVTAGRGLYLVSSAISYCLVKTGIGISDLEFPKKEKLDVNKSIEQSQNEKVYKFSELAKNIFKNTFWPDVGDLNLKTPVTPVNVVRARKNWLNLEKSLQELFSGSWRVSKGLLNFFRYGTSGKIYGIRKWYLEKAKQAELEVQEVEDMTDVLIKFHRFKKKQAERLEDQSLDDLTGICAVIGNTISSLGYLLGTLSEITLISDEKFEDRRNELAMKSKILLNRGKDAISKLINTVVVPIGEQIEKKWPGKIGKNIRNNVIKLMIVLSFAGYGGYRGTELINQWRNIRKYGYSVSFEEKKYFKNVDFFNKDFKTVIDTTYTDMGIILIRDVGMSFYVVQEGETTKKQIREKLSSIPEFKYLKDSTYNDKITGFNVPDLSLIKGFYLPIPVKATDRKIETEQFREYSRIAIQKMKNNSYYGKMTQKLIGEVGEKKVIDIMTAFARCETAMDQKTFSDSIGTAELYRWESVHGSFSFSYYHILMEKNKDGKTSGPGLKARQKLGLTEGQCYHPINAGKLFLGYCFEKKPNDPTYFFKIGNLGEAKIKGGKYNGNPSYGEKLWANIQYLEDNKYRVKFKSLNKKTRGLYK